MLFRLVVTHRSAVCDNLTRAKLVSTSGTEIRMQIAWSNKVTNNVETIEQANNYFTYLSKDQFSCNPACREPENKQRYGSNQLLYIWIVISKIELPTLSSIWKKNCPANIEFHVRSLEVIRYLIWYACIHKQHVRIFVFKNIAHPYRIFARVKWTGQWYAYNVMR